ncbi:AGE family epimerase/isomerase [Falsiroseomonas sp. CW058]|uniref:AGE family epimerase/isomerase n=1 Tax=Falsiroseomonas sp. CW058 TaxID=3388664 RepID=UPI003D3148DB
MTTDFAWLRDQAWPLWLERGIDRDRGGFHEWLDPATLGCDAPYRRLRVAARQVWTFARAARHGLPGAGDAVALGLDFLARRARRPGGGYATRFDLAGAVTDPRLDTYDNAFCLLAFAATGERQAAMAQLALFEGPLRHPLGGWREGLPEVPGEARRQNPHMHLLEALHEAFLAFAEPRCLDLAEEVAGLFTDRFLDPATGTLPESFDETLAPLRQGGRHAVEPGHHCEWAWLLRRHVALLGTAGRPVPPGLPTLPARLLDFARRHGIGPAHGAMVDEVWSDGTAKSGGARLWPQAEWRRADPGPASAAALAAQVAGAPGGLWQERRDAAGQPVPGPVPASSLYHLTGALMT